jgi:hypothetical protein
MSNLRFSTREYVSVFLLGCNAVQTPLSPHCETTQNNNTSALKMETERSLEALVSTYWSQRRQNPE